jgi:hypothetical protein
LSDRAVANRKEKTNADDRRFEKMGQRPAPKSIVEKKTLEKSASKKFDRLLAQESKRRA